jgi:phosphoribosylanthranilate isomerase
MALKTFVKIGGITNLSDARYCSGMYVDLIGFSLENSSDKYISQAAYSEITGWLSGLEYAGEFTNTSSQSVLEILSNYPSVTWIEHEEIETLLELKESGYSLILKLDIDSIQGIENQLIEKISESKIMIHLTSKDESLSERGKKMIQYFSERSQVILGAGINPESVESLLNSYPLKGIGLTGGTEIKPGLKDFDELADILEKLEIED